MIHSDYIMRMVTMLGTFLSRVLLQKHGKNFPLALTEIDQAGRTLVGVDRSMIRLFSAEQLMALFGNDRTVAMPKAYVLGALMTEEAEILELQGQETEAYPVRLKALHLLLATFVDGEGPIEEEHQGRIDRCLSGLAGEPLPVPELFLLVRQLETAGRYARAEDRLHELLEQAPDQQGFAASFYDRLLKRTAEELEAGGLTRDEVIEARAELARRRNV